MRQSAKGGRVASYGRGGAGNFRVEEEGGREAREREREKVYEEVVRGVERGLSRPEEAHLGWVRVR